MNQTRSTQNNYSGNGPDGGAGGDPDERRIGERVAKQSLQSSPGHSERGARHDGQQNPRQAYRPQHRPEGFLRIGGKYFGVNILPKLYPGQRDKLGKTDFYGTFGQGNDGCQQQD